MDITQKQNQEFAYVRNAVMYANHALPKELIIALIASMAMQNL